MKHVLLAAALLSFAQAPPTTKAEQLQDAARKGDAATVRKLLDEGVDVNTKFRYNATALFYACDAGNVDVVKVLLDKGADMSGKDTFYGFTPLMLALNPARKKTPAHNEIARLLIAKGAPGKDMALASAVESNDASLATFLLDSGGLTASNLSEALETAKLRNKTEMVALLERAGAKPYEDFTLTPEQLARFAGSYKNAGGNEFTVVVNGARLSVGPTAAPPAQRLTFVAKDATSFRVIGPQTGSASFKVDNDKVVSMTITIGPNNILFTRVEGR